MAFRYDTHDKETMRVYFDRFGENDDRRYVAVQAKKLPKEGIVYISKIWGCAKRTIRRGLEDLAIIEQQGDPAEGRER